VEAGLAPELQTGTKLQDLQTEADASEYAATITAILNPRVKTGGA
jgi:hypothetical protein